MKKVFLSLIIILFTLVLSSCKANPLDFSNEELIVNSSYTTLSLNEDIYLSELRDLGYDFGVYESDMINEAGNYFVYKRLFFITDVFTARMVILYDMLNEYYEEIVERFDDVNDIEYIIFNRELKVLSILPKDTFTFTDRNSLIINVNQFITNYNDENSSNITASVFSLFHGINIRDLIVSQLNYEKNERSFITLKSLFFHLIINSSSDNTLRYIDIKIDVENNKAIYISSLINDMPILSTDNAYRDIDGIPIKISQDFSDLSNDTDEKIKDDVIISSEMDCNINFYDNSDD